MPAILNPNELQILVVVLTPNEGRYYHWMLVIRDTAPTTRIAWHIYEAARSRPGGWFNVLRSNADPRDHPGCRTPMLLVARAEAAALDRLKRSVEVVKASRDDLHWDCQNYVDEVLKKLVDDGNVSEEERVAAWEKLAPYHGEMKVGFEHLPKPTGRKKEVPLTPEFVVDEDSSDE